MFHTALKTLTEDVHKTVVAVYTLCGTNPMAEHTHTIFVPLLLQLEGLEIPTSLRRVPDFSRLPWRAAECEGERFSTLTVILSAQIKINEKQSMRVLSYRSGLSPENSKTGFHFLFLRILLQSM